MVPCVHTELRAYIKWLDLAFTLNNIVFLEGILEYYYHTTPGEPLQGLHGNSTGGLFLKKPIFKTFFNIRYINALTLIIEPILLHTSLHLD